MANRGDVISVDKLWDIFDLEREKAWEGVDAPIGSQEWEAAAGKIDTINNICISIHAPRVGSDSKTAQILLEILSHLNSFAPSEKKKIPFHRKEQGKFIEIF